MQPCPSLTGEQLEPLKAGSPSGARRGAKLTSSWLLGFLGFFTLWTLFLVVSTVACFLTVLDRSRALRSRSFVELRKQQELEDSASVIRSLAASGFLHLSPLPPGRQGSEEVESVRREVFRSRARAKLTPSRGSPPHILPAKALFRVNGVHRVHSPVQQAVYEALKEAMGGQAEKRLWHFATSTGMAGIVTGGFNRNYGAFRNVPNQLGSGVYFATEIWDMFPVFPGETKLVILSKVLVGNSTGPPGYMDSTRDLAEPPLRSTSRLQHWDAVVEPSEHPWQVCIYSDFQAIPEYVIELEYL